MLKEKILNYARIKGVLAFTNSALTLIIDGCDNINFYEKIKHLFHIDNTDIYNVYNVIDAVDYNLTDEQRDIFIHNLNMNDNSIDCYDKSLYLEEFYQTFDPSFTQQDLIRIFRKNIDCPTLLQTIKGPVISQYNVEKCEAFVYINEMLDIIDYVDFYACYYTVLNIYHEMTLRLL